MDSPILQGTLLVVLMAAFVGLWIWAWSHKRKEVFRDASMLPLEEDDGAVPDNTEHKE